MKKLYAFFFLMPLLCAGAAAQPKWGENLVKNPSFSDERTGWTCDDNCEIQKIFYWGEDGEGKSPGDYYLAFYAVRGSFSQSISLSDCGFSAADLDGASLRISVEAYHWQSGGDVNVAVPFSAVFVLSGGLFRHEVELIPDSARRGLRPWTTFCDTVQLSDAGGANNVVVTLSGATPGMARLGVGPMFDNVSVSVIRGDATALPASPAVAADASEPLFDLQGRRVSKPVRGRPYVQGGRLKVAR